MRVAVFVNGKRASTVLAQNEQDLVDNIIPYAIQMCTRKGLGTLQELKKGEDSQIIGVYLKNPDRIPRASSGGRTRRTAAIDINRWKASRRLPVCPKVWMES